MMRQRSAPICLGRRRSTHTMHCRQTLGGTALRYRCAHAENGRARASSCASAPIAPPSGGMPLPRPTCRSSRLAHRVSTPVRPRVAAPPALWFLLGRSRRRPRRLACCGCRRPHQVFCLLVQGVRLRPQDAADSLAQHHSGGCMSSAQAHRRSAPVTRRVSDRRGRRLHRVSQ